MEEREERDWERVSAAFSFCLKKMPHFSVLERKSRIAQDPGPAAAAAV